MSERGVFAVDRGIWDHPMFCSRKPFTHREAWLWILSEASWKDRLVRVDGRNIIVKRGQLAHSIRFMGDQWRWPKSNVLRFLDALKTETMIGTDIGTGITIITVLKYNDYQKVSLPDRDSNRDTERDISGTPAGHKWDKDKDIKSIEVNNDDRPREPLISKEAVELADEVSRIVGHNPSDPPPQWYGQRCMFRNGSVRAGPAKLFW